MDNKISSNYDTKVFGVSLPHLLSRPSQSLFGDVPSTVEILISSLEERALDVEGIFRIPGDAFDIEQFRKNCDEGHGLPLSDCQNVHTIAGLLKLFLRELPDPLFTYNYYDTLIDIQKQQSQQYRLSVLRELINSLPGPNKALLSRLCGFLLKVVSHAESNKMTIQNLAAIFAPNLIRGRKEELMDMLQNARFVNGIILLVLEEYDFFFLGAPKPKTLNDWEDEAASPQVESNHNKRNRRRGFRLEIEIPEPAPPRSSNLVNLSSLATSEGPPSATDPQSDAHPDEPNGSSPRGRTGKTTGSPGSGSPYLSVPGSASTSPSHAGSGLSRSSSGVSPFRRLFRLKKDGDSFTSFPVSSSSPANNYPNLVGSPTHNHSPSDRSVSPLPPDKREEIPTIIEESPNGELQKKKRLSGLSLLTGLSKGVFQRKTRYSMAPTTSPTQLDQLSSSNAPLRHSVLINPPPAHPLFDNNNNKVASNLSGPVPTLHMILERLQQDRATQSRPEAIQEMTLLQLHQEFSLLSKELSDYDQNFKAHFNTFPSEEDKEPLRGLYELLDSVEGIIKEKMQHTNNCIYNPEPQE